MDSEFIYRLRPCNDNTLDELANSYLWFSRPTEFKGDANDANIGAFITQTAALKRGFERVFSELDFQEWYRKMSYIGICSFTNIEPTLGTLMHFPNGHTGNMVCFKFKRKELEEYFLTKSRYVMHPCFHKVKYDDRPAELDQFGEWSFLWEEGDGYKLYKTIPGLMNEHPRELDKLIFMLLSRLNSKFKYQNEERMILGGKIFHHIKMM